MATSGTYDFDLNLGQGIIQAFGRCKVGRTEITAQHMADARIAANLLFEEWAGDQPHLWTVDLYSLPLTQGVATYELPPETVLTLDVYQRTTIGGVNTDRIMWSISRSEYAAFPQKLQEGAPTQYWFERTLVPTINFYLAPDGKGPYTAQIYRARYIEDAVPTMGQSPAIPRWFYPAFISGLAARLSETYAPDMYDALETRHQLRLAKATSQDQEDADLEIYPGLRGYYR